MHTKPEQKEKEAEVRSAQKLKKIQEQERLKAKTKKLCEEFALKKENISTLHAMGFEYGACVHAIESMHGSVELAATILLQGQYPNTEDISPPAHTPADRSGTIRDTKVTSSTTTTTQSKQETLTRKSSSSPFTTATTATATATATAGGNCTGRHSPGIDSNSDVVQRLLDMLQQAAPQGINGEHFGKMYATQYKNDLKSALRGKKLTTVLLDTGQAKQIHRPDSGLPIWYYQASVTDSSRVKPVGPSAVAVKYNPPSPIAVNGETAAVKSSYPSNTSFVQSNMTVPPVLDADEFPSLSRREASTASNSNYMDVLSNPMGDMKLSGSALMSNIQSMPPQRQTTNLYQMEPRWQESLTQQQQQHQLQQHQLQQHQLQQHEYLSSRASIVKDQQQQDNLQQHAIFTSTMQDSNKYESVLKIPLISASEMQQLQETSAATVASVTAPERRSGHKNINQSNTPHLSERQIPRQGNCLPCSNMIISGSAVRGGGDISDAADAALFATSDLSKTPNNIPRRSSPLSATVNQIFDPLSSTNLSLSAVTAPSFNLPSHYQQPRQYHQAPQSHQEQSQFSARMNIVQPISFAPNQPIMLQHHQMQHPPESKLFPTVGMSQQQKQFRPLQQSLSQPQSLPQPQLKSPQSFFSAGSVIGPSQTQSQNYHLPAFDISTFGETRTTAMPPLAVTGSLFSSNCYPPCTQPRASVPASTAAVPAPAANRSKLL